MSAWLIAIVGVVYAVVAGDLLLKGNTGLGIAFVGYEMAVQERYKPTHFICHDGVVYRGVHNHWESTGQKCLTPEQMKGVV